MKLKEERASERKMGKREEEEKEGGRRESWIRVLPVAQSVKWCHLNFEVTSLKLREVKCLSSDDLVSGKTQIQTQSDLLQNMFDFATQRKHYICQAAGFGAAPCRGEESPINASTQVPLITHSFRLLMTIE